MTRNLFEWQAPPGVSIVQTVLEPVRLQNGTEWRGIAFAARCEGCGHLTEPRAARCDAIDDLERAGHPCQPR